MYSEHCDNLNLMPFLWYPSVGSESRNISVQGHPQLHKEAKASRRPCFNKQKQKYPLKMV